MRKRERKKMESFTVYQYLELVLGYSEKVISAESGIPVTTYHKFTYDGKYICVIQDLSKQPTTPLQIKINNNDPIDITGYEVLQDGSIKNVYTRKINTKLGRKNGKTGWMTSIPNSYIYEWKEYDQSIKFRDWILFNIDFHPILGEIIKSAYELGYEMGKNSGFAISHMAAYYKNPNVITYRGYIIHVFTDRFNIYKSDEKGDVKLYQSVKFS